MKKLKNNAFTLIELLVVISIIAILAGIALPVFGEVQTRGAQTKALSNAKQIGLACKLFAGDYSGAFPAYTDIKSTPKVPAAAGTDSNAIFSTLIPDYVPEKAIFAIGKSYFCTAAGTGSDPLVLSAKENEWAYLYPLTDTSSGRYPLIASGFDSPTDGTYSEIDTEKGGVWKGKKAIVIRCDISGAVEPVNRSSHTVQRGDNDSKSIFVSGNSSDGTVWFGPSVTVGNPKD
jgi:prepilin-type N-terminal cleavage/methylation domain-containing protein